MSKIERMVSQFGLLGALACQPIIASEDSPSVVVVGAGLSGLTAAHRLQKLGVDVEVYEANVRPGGRVYSFYFDDGSYEELGGSNFSDAQDQVEVLQLIQEMGLELEQRPSFGMQKAFCQFPEMARTPMRSIFRGAREPTPEMLDLARPWMDQTHSLAELLQKIFSDEPELHTFFQYFYHCYEGSSPKYLTSHYLEISLWEFYKHFWHISQEVFVSPVGYKTSIVGGNSRLIHALADSLPIRYRSILQKIERGRKKKFRLIFAEGLFLEADYVILTLPCTTLRQVQVEDGVIPQDQWRAIETLQYATHGKVVLPIASERKEVSLFTGQFCTWTNQEGLLTFYQYGAAGVLDATSSDAVQRVVEQNWEAVTAVYPDVQRAGAKEAQLLRGQSHGLLAPVVISWLHEPFAKGSYSNFGVDASLSFAERKRVDLIRGEEVLHLFRPVENRLFFAGEHTALVDFATLGGAIQSGEKAARMVYRELVIEDATKKSFFQECLEAK